MFEQFLITIPSCSAYSYIYTGKLISTDPLALPASRFLIPISSSNSAQMLILQKYDSCKFKKKFAKSQTDILKDETLVAYSYIQLYIN